MLCYVFLVEMFDLDTFEINYNCIYACVVRMGFMILLQKNVSLRMLTEKVWKCGNILDKNLT